MARIKPRKVKIMRGRSVVETDLFEDTETGRIYRQVIAGVGWPYADRSGFILAMGEEKDQDHSLPFSPRHVHVLSEFESPDLEALHRECARLREELCVRSFYGHPETLVYSRLWCNLGGLTRITISAPPDFEEMDLNFVQQLIRRRTSIQKTLHIGEGRKLPGYLQQLRAEDVQTGDLAAYPAVAACGYVLTYLESGGTGLAGRYTPPRPGSSRRPTGRRYFSPW